VTSLYTSVATALTGTLDFISESVIFKITSKFMAFGTANFMVDQRSLYQWSSANHNTPKDTIGAGHGYKGEILPRGDGTPILEAELVQ
jgi:hypothetical protein